MERREGILGSMERGEWGSCCLRWGVRGGVGGWWEGGGAPCSAEDRRPGWRGRGARLGGSGP